MPLNAAEMLLDFQRLEGVPFRRRLAMVLREAIRAGQLPPGTSLPSSRILAEDLGLSRGVVVDVYAQLAAEGYLEARPGSGTRVAAITTVAWPSAEQSGRTHVSPATLDLRAGAPDTAEFPRALWLATLKDVFRALPHEDLGYGEPAGTWALRAQLAAYLSRVRGAMCRPEHVVVVSGATQGMTLLMRVLQASGHSEVAVEDPSNAIQRGVLRRHGLDVIDVPVDADGLVVEALERTTARAVIVTPAHQYPSGVVLSAARRNALLRWARDQGGLIVEDDYDSEFRYDRHPVGVLQGRDPEHVALVGTVSKTLAPGLRLGWVSSPPALLARLLAAKHDDDYGSPILEQHVLARLLDSGAYDRHLRQLRRTYRLRRDTLVSALAHRLPSWSVMGTAAGSHLVAALPEPLVEGPLVAAAADRGLLLTGMREMSGRHVIGPALVLSYARHSPDQLSRAVSALGALVDNVLRTEAASASPGHSGTAEHSQAGAGHRCADEGLRG